MRPRRSPLFLVAFAAGCGADPSTPPAPQPIDRIVDTAARAVWPGVEAPDGRRVVPRVGAWYDGHPVSFWFGGTASRMTADVFWFCHRGDAECPLDAAGVLRAERAVGGPIFARIPGEAGYTPYWLVWRVLVDDDHAPDAITSVFDLEAATADGEVEIELLRFDHGGDIGPDSAVMNCLLVLGQTELEGNGGAMAGRPEARSRAIPLRHGWHKGYRVGFFDFTPTEGVIPPDPGSESRPQMPAGDLYVLMRDCAGGSTSPVCVAGHDAAVVDERLLGVDFTGDGDLDDSNDVLSGVPGAARDEAGARYTALWRVMGVRVRAGADDAVPLADTPGRASAVTRFADLEALIEAGLADPPEPLRPAALGLPARAGAEETLFNGATQRAANGSPW